MLSNQAIVFSHSGQNERAGVTTERSRGRRKIHTFRKLPISNPARNASSTKIILKPLDRHSRFFPPFFLLRIAVALARGRTARFAQPALHLPASAGLVLQNRHRSPGNRSCPFPLPRAARRRQKQLPGRPRPWPPAQQTPDPPYRFYRRTRWRSTNP